MNKLSFVVKVITALLLLLFLNSCATISLRYNVYDLSSCFQVGTSIDEFNQCKDQYKFSSFSYFYMNPSNHSLHQVKAICSASYTELAPKRCSSLDLQNKLVVYGAPVDGEWITIPTVTIFSQYGNLGGAFLRLTIFFDPEDMTIVGWYNWGSTDFKLKGSVREKFRDD